MSDEQAPMEQEGSGIFEAASEVTVEPAEPLKVSWGETDVTPVPTTHEVRLVRIYANESGRQLRVMKTADAEDCLHIYVDVV